MSGNELWYRQLSLLLLYIYFPSVALNLWWRILQKQWELLEIRFTSHAKSVGFLWSCRAGENSYTILDKCVCVSTAFLSWTLEKFEMPLFHLFLNDFFKNIALISLLEVAIMYFYAFNILINKTTTTILHSELLFFPWGVFPSSTRSPPSTLDKLIFQWCIQTCSSFS